MDAFTIIVGLILLPVVISVMAMSVMFIMPILASHSARLSIQDGVQFTGSLKQSTALLGNAQELQDRLKE